MCGGSTTILGLRPEPRKFGRIWRKVDKLAGLCIAAHNKSVQAGSLLRESISQSGAHQMRYVQERESEIVRP
jgi:hypothetical protein